MSAQIIDGKAIAATIRGEIKAEVDAMQTRYSQVPGLATVLVGERKDSQTYVRMKKKACAEVGIASFSHDLPADISQADLLKVVQDLNAHPEVNGILVQLPLPDHINEEEILSAISLTKDVDGFHPINIGRLSMKRRAPLFVPCTPKAASSYLTAAGSRLRAASCGFGPQQHCGPAGGHAAAAPQRHLDYLPFPHPKLAANRPRGRYFDRRCGPA